ncbi:UDP-N-acetylglucosamine 2-epimerase [Candidatus Peregrinibacteria bacterium]|nr:UDP-N-acetylglucosamine 2-epimerase [Candidatus Peregrinibacteria bacterium]
MEGITFRSPRFFEEMADHKDRHVHVILIATKPDIIKQVPLYRELKKRGHIAVLGHTGQHYDENLSGGMLKEFGVEPDFNLNVRGEMYEVVSQIIGRLGWLIREIKRGPARRSSKSGGGKTVIPYVHGDTTTAMAASNAGFCHGFASVHVEAGIRTLTPKYVEYGMLNVGKSNIPYSTFNIPEWRKFLMNKNNWERGSLEPYPEQFNTRCSECATGIHLAPVELDREFMLSEGFPEDRIFVVGNSVVDATEEALKQAKKSKIFEKYPVLKNGDFVRFCIHRRENCISEKRFMAIYNAMKSLIEDGRKVLLISMIQTKAAFKRFNLESEVMTLAKKHPNFVLSDVWPEYGDVIAAMDKAAVCATDSGSMQEEMNALGVPCVTLRFGSDRSESAMGGGNLIAPPMDAALVKKMIEFAWDNKDMRKAPKLYGKNVSSTCIDAVEKVLASGEVFRTDEERLRVLE